MAKVDSGQRAGFHGDTYVTTDGLVYNYTATFDTIEDAEMCRALIKRRDDCFVRIIKRAAGTKCGNTIFKVYVCNPDRSAALVAKPNQARAKNRGNRGKKVKALIEREKIEEQFEVNGLVHKLIDTYKDRKDAERVARQVFGRVVVYVPNEGKYAVYANFDT